MIVTKPLNTNFDIHQLFAQYRGKNNALYAQNINPKLARALKIIGFDKNYVKGCGAYLWDEEGARYLDMLSGYGVFNIGRNHPIVRQALIDFMQAEYSSLVQMETPLLCALLARELKTRIGYDLNYVYFCSTGAEVNEAAIKFARRATGKNTILYAQSAFHGLTTGVLSINGSRIFKRGFGELIGSRSVRFGDLEQLEEELAKDDCAAFFIEPIQGKGVNIPPRGYMAEASRLCRKHGVLFVADEIQCGLGRTGKFLALHHEENISPDLVTVSKSLSGGYVPIAAVAMRKAVFDKTFSSLDRAVVHSSTFGKSNFAMTAGLATLHVLDQSDLMTNAEKMGNLLGNRLLQLKDKYELIHAVRWRGLMLAIEFGRPTSLGLRAAWEAINAINKDLFCQAVTIPLLQDHNILTQVAGNHMTTIKLLPPLVINKDDVDWFIHSLDEVMADLHRFPGPAWESLSRIAKNTFTQSGMGLVTK